MGTGTTVIRDCKGDSGIIGLTRKQPADNLACTHEEADTRMLLHAMDADLKFQDTDGRIIIKTPDTDVVSLVVYYIPQMKHVSEFWIETGTVTRTADLRRFIPVHEICKSLGPSFCTILPVVHALSGIRKTYMYVLKTVHDTGPDVILDLSELYGNDDQGAPRAGRKFIAAFYDPKQKAGRYQGSLTDLRFRLSTTKETAPF